MIRDWLLGALAAYLAKGAPPPPAPAPRVEPKLDAMTPKIARFLAEQQPATPCLVLDVDRVEANFRALQRSLPRARIYYAVKANPARPVLERLARLGSSFDAASFEEVAGCLDAGARRAASPGRGAQPEVTVPLLR